jgi:hypothetical protein
MNPAGTKLPLARKLKTNTVFKLLGVKKTNELFLN